MRYLYAVAYRLSGNKTWSLALHTSKRKATDVVRQWRREFGVGRIADPVAIPLPEPEPPPSAPAMRRGEGTEGEK